MILARRFNAGFTGALFRSSRRDDWESGGAIVAERDDDGCDFGSRRWNAGL